VRKIKLHYLFDQTFAAEKGNEYTMMRLIREKEISESGL
jgi:hypothetical protein